MAELHDLKSERPLEIPTTVKICSKTFKLMENDVRFKLTVVDTPGFGDLVDNSNWFIFIYDEKQYQKLIIKLGADSQIH